MKTKLNKILAEISAGELIDKITILEIKRVKITDEGKLIEINKELLSLSLILKKIFLIYLKLIILKATLKILI